MPTGARLEWDGDQLLERVTRAAIAAVNDTTQAADDDASASHWWKNRTGNLELQTITESAKLIGSRVVGSFGTTYSGTKGVRSGFYGLFLEYKFPFLRPAADRQYPTLAERIRGRLR